MWGYYEYRKRIKVKGGIKAQTKKGSFGHSWWAKRWNDTIEEYDIGERISRAKTYARKGQVKSINIQNGMITAQVYGSWKYDVVIKIKTIDRGIWEAVARDMFSLPGAVAKMLSGQMPEEIEGVFARRKTRLFPSKKELDTDCTCMDWSNPCKHIAAVYFLLGEEFDRDPFLIFKLRGMERDEFLNIMGITPTKLVTQRVKPAKARLKERPLPVEPDKFWGDIVESEYLANAKVPAVNATLVKQLGSFPFWRSEENFISTMEAIYQNASELGVKVFLGQTLENKDTK